MGPKELYLIVYNVCLCVGWSVVFAGAVTTVALGVADDGLVGALSNVYATNGLALILTYSQTAAILEIVHAAIGLVRSPVIVTAMQVGSRIVALVAINGSVEAQSKSDVYRRWNVAYSALTIIASDTPNYSPMGCWPHDLVVVAR
jgi:Protein tyrosine phosphatase-like protein, PTPLA